MSAASDEFVREMLDGECWPMDRWLNFDPPFARSTVKAFERRGWVETRTKDGYVEHRWTAYGQAEQIAAYLRSLGYVVTRPHGLPDKLKAIPAGATPTPAHGDGAGGIAGEAVPAQEGRTP